MNRSYKCGLGPFEKKKKIKFSNEVFASFLETDIAIQISKNIINIHDNLNLGKKKLN